MSFRINSNLEALTAHRNLSVVSGRLAKTMERLSSGLRINRASDDAAGLAISEKLLAQIRGLNQAVRNAQDAISLLQTAEGALQESHGILQRMRELAVQAANESLALSDRWQIQLEMNQLASEVKRIADTTEFNRKTLLDGTFRDVWFHIGANAGQGMTVSIENMSASALGVVTSTAAWEADKGTTNFDATSTSNAGIGNLKTGSYSVVVAADGKVSLRAKDGTEIGTGTLADAGTSVDITVTKTEFLVDSTNTKITLAISDTDSAAGTVATAAGTITLYVLGSGEGLNILSAKSADSAVAALDAAIDRVSGQRAELGAIQNRLEHTIANLQVASENLQAANSRIRDVDMAAEMVEFTKLQILQQAGTAVLAQANVSPQAVLKLLS